MIGLAAVLLAATFTRPLERVATMDPVEAQGVYDMHALRLVYETPLAIDYRARPYRLVPGACELPKVSDDGLEYVFRMRPTGAPGRGRDDGVLVASDVVRSLRRFNDGSSPNGWMMKGVESVSAADDRTVVVRLKARCHYFPWLMAMEQASIVREDGTGTGPYVLSDWWKNHEMRFECVGRCAGFDTVRYLVVDDASTQWLMFLRGELDFLGEVSRDNWDAVVGADGRIAKDLADRGIELYSTSTMESMYIGINMSDPVLGPNRKLRQALNAAFDYPEWERFYSGRIIAADGPIPPCVDGRLEGGFKYAFNPVLARRLLDEAGYPGGIDRKTGKRLVLTMAIGRASQDSREAAELIAAFYERVGIRLELDYYTWEAYLRAVNDGNVQLFRMGWVGDYPDAQNFLQLFYGPNRRPGPNRGNYANADYDLAYETALKAADSGSRNVQWRKCQEILREDCPWVFTHFNKANTLVGPRVGNYVPSDFPYGHAAKYEVRSCGVGARGR